MPPIGDSYKENFFLELILRLCRLFATNITAIIMSALNSKVASIFSFWYEYNLVLNAIDKENPT